MAAAPRAAWQARLSRAPSAVTMPRGDLIQQVGQYGSAPDLVVGDLHGPDFQRFRVHPE